jgi:hypothetical protein
VVEQRDIEIFLTLAEELHFGRTAERLHLSTARVSQTIKKLERRIGAALFERTSRQVALTPIGRRLDDDLRPAYQQIRDGLNRAITAGRGVEGVLRAGFIGTAVGQFLYQAGENFPMRAPTTRGRTSPTFRSGMACPGSAGSSGEPRRKPTGSVPSAKPSWIWSVRGLTRCSTPNPRTSRRRGGRSCAGLAG